ncbi:hypothetical protein TB1_042254 [Malus domestica]
MLSPVPDNVFVSQLSRFVLSWYDAVLAVSLTCAVMHPVLNFTSASSSISKLRDAPAIKVSNLRSILPFDQSDKLIVVRGTVEAKSTVDSTWTSLKSAVDSTWTSLKSDRLHVQYYQAGPTCGGMKEKVKEIKKKVKLLKGLSKNLAVYSQIGFEPLDSQEGLVDQLQGKMILESAEEL